MDTLLLLPFQLWGTSPHISRNIYPVFHRPRFQGIEIRYTDDAGILLRKGFTPLKDTIPFTHIYSLQISDTFYLFGGGMEKPFVKRADSSSPAQIDGSIQAYYDYAGRFKQATITGRKGKWSAGFIDAYKVNQSLRLLYLRNGENWLAIEELNGLQSVGLYTRYLSAWYLKDAFELNPKIPFHFHNIEGQAGLHITRYRILPQYFLKVSMGRVSLSSRYTPFYFEKQSLLAREHFHMLSLDMHWLSLSAGYGNLLVPYDTTAWRERDVIAGHIGINLPHIRIQMDRYIHSPIGFSGRVKLFREFHPWVHVKLMPYAQVMYIENQFETLDIEDIFHLSAGVAGTFYDAVRLDISYEGNAGVESLWEGNFYKIFMWIDLED